MDYNKAIEVLKNFDTQVCVKADGVYQTNVGKEACDMAISAMEVLRDAPLSVAQINYLLNKYGDDEFMVCLDSKELRERKPLAEKLALYCITEGRNSTTTGNWHISFAQIAAAFGITEKDVWRIHRDITKLIDQCEEIASPTKIDQDEFLDECGFDMNFYEQNNEGSGMDA